MFSLDGAIQWILLVEFLSRSKAFLRSISNSIYNSLDRSAQLILDETVQLECIHILKKVREVVHIRGDIRCWEYLDK